ncbi:MAG: hypothetical protein WBC93_06300 [Sulfitobacter sp.]
MTPRGLSYVLNRLTNCPDLASLKLVWSNLGDEPKRHPEVVAHKDKLKEGFLSG